MATYVLVHAAGDGAWVWHLVERELRSLGHDVVAPDLPEGDDAGLDTYRDVVLDAIGGRTQLIVVGHSFGAFTAPLVCEGAPAELLVLLAAMIPAPGEPPDDWWANTRHGEEVADAGDVMATFYHDVPADLAAEALRRERDHPGARAGREPWPLEAWPDVPTRVLGCRDDRLFPPAFMSRVARERLGIEPDEVPGGHCVALARPRELAAKLDGYSGGGRA
jgi:pimeloyl-ACP methyl ester carboxylesterase